jgi:hypothetical protein
LLIVEGVLVFLLLVDAFIFALGKGLRKSYVDLGAATQRLEQRDEVEETDRPGRKHDERNRPTDADRGSQDGVSDGESDRDGDATRGGKTFGRGALRWLWWTRLLMLLLMVADLSTRSVVLYTTGRMALLLPLTALLRPVLFVSRVPSLRAAIMAFSKTVLHARRVISLWFSFLLVTASLSLALFGGDAAAVSASSIASSSDSDTASLSPPSASLSGVYGGAVLTADVTADGASASLASPSSFSGFGTSSASATAAASGLTLTAEQSRAEAVSLLFHGGQGGAATDAIIASSALTAASASSASSTSSSEGLSSAQGSAASAASAGGSEAPSEVGRGFGSFLQAFLTTFIFVTTGENWDVIHERHGRAAIDGAAGTGVAWALSESATGVIREAGLPADSVLARQALLGANTVAGVAAASWLDLVQRPYFVVVSFLGLFVLSALLIASFQNQYTQQEVRRRRQLLWQRRVAMVIAFIVLDDDESTFLERDEYAQFYTAIGVRPSHWKALPSRLSVATFVRFNELLMNSLQFHIGSGEYSREQTIISSAADRARLFVRCFWWCLAGSAAAAGSRASASRPGLEGSGSAATTASASDAPGSDTVTCHQRAALLSARMRVWLQGFRHWLRAFFNNELTVSFDAVSGVVVVVHIWLVALYGSTWSSSVDSALTVVLLWYVLELLLRGLAVGWKTFFQGPRTLRLATVQRLVGTMDGARDNPAAKQHQPSSSSSSSPSPSGRLPGGSKGQRSSIQSETSPGSYSPSNSSNQHPIAPTASAVVGGISALASPSASDHSGAAAKPKARPAPSSLGTVKATTRASQSGGHSAASEVRQIRTGASKSSRVVRFQTAANRCDCGIILVSAALVLIGLSSNTTALDSVASSSQRGDDTAALAAATVTAGGRVTRLGLVLPVLRLFSVVHTTRELVFGLLVRLPAYAPLLAAMLSAMYLYAVVGCWLFGGLLTALPPSVYSMQRANFNTFDSAVTTLSQLLVGEGWHDVMYGTFSALNTVWPAAYFVTFIAMNTLLFSSIFVGIVCDTFEAIQRRSLDRQDSGAK